MDISSEAGRWLVECCDSGLARTSACDPSSGLTEAWVRWLTDSSHWMAHLLLMLVMDVPSDTADTEVRRTASSTLLRQKLLRYAREASDMYCGDGRWISTALVTRAADDVTATVLAVRCGPADLHRSAPQTGDTALHLAALNGMEKTARVLIAMRADVNTLNCAGRSALQEASAFGHSTLCQLLSDSGAIISCQPLVPPAPARVPVPTWQEEWAGGLTTDRSSSCGRCDVVDRTRPQPAAVSSGFDRRDLRGIGQVACSTGALSSLPRWQHRPSAQAIRRLIHAEQPVLLEGSVASDALSRLLAELAQQHPAGVSVEKGSWRHTPCTAATVPFPARYCPSRARAIPESKPAANSEGNEKATMPLWQFLREHMGDQLTKDSAKRNGERYPVKRRRLLGERSGSPQVDKQGEVSAAAAAAAAAATAAVVETMAERAPLIVFELSPSAKILNNPPHRSWCALPCLPFGGSGRRGMDASLSLGELAPELAWVCHALWGKLNLQLPSSNSAVNDVHVMGTAGAPVVQWSLGGAGAGAPCHFHGAALNQVLVANCASGAKLWFFYPPGAAILSSEAAWDWYRRTQQPSPSSQSLRASESPPLASSSSQSSLPLRVLQRAGEIIYVPQRWGHVTLNVCDTFSIAVETSDTRSQWLTRIREMRSCPT